MAFMFLRQFRWHVGSKNKKMSQSFQPFFVVCALLLYIYIYAYMLEILRTGLVRTEPFSWYMVLIGRVEPKKIPGNEVRKYTYRLHCFIGRIQNLLMKNSLPK